jgi:hypothetical protein
VGKVAGFDSLSPFGNADRAEQDGGSNHSQEETRGVTCMVVQPERLHSLGLGVQDGAETQAGRSSGLMGSGGGGGVAGAPSFATRSMAMRQAYGD